MDTRTSASRSSAKCVRGYSSIDVESVRVSNTIAPARSSSVLALNATARVATGSHSPLGPPAPPALAVLHPVDVGRTTVQAQRQTALPLRDLIRETRGQRHAQRHGLRPGREPYRAH